MTGRDKQKIAIGVVIAGTILAGALAFFAMHKERRSFENAVRVGMSKSQVRRAIGEPAAILPAGNLVERWGNAEGRIADQETWVFYVVPKSQHRFLLTFSDDKLTDITHGQN